jgi:hypothetical protein
MPSSYIPNHYCCPITQTFSIQTSLISQSCMSEKISFPYMTFCFHQQLQLYWLPQTEDDRILSSISVTMFSFFSQPTPSDHTMSSFQNKNWNLSLWLHVWKESHFTYTDRYFINPTLVPTRVNMKHVMRLHCTMQLEQKRH